MKEETTGREIRVALVGSSACEGYGNTDPRLIAGWGEVIGAFFQPHVKLLNFALSGYSSKKFIDDGLWDKTLKAKPDYILIGIGVNDTRPEPDFHTEPEEYRANLMRFLRETREIGAVPVFITLNLELCYDAEHNKAVFNNGRAFTPAREPYSRVMREVAAAEHVPCADLAKLQQEALEAMGEDAAGKLYRMMDLETMKVDPSHTNRKGAELLAELIVKAIAGSNSPLKQELTINRKG